MVCKMMIYRMSMVIGDAVNAPSVLTTEMEQQKHEAIVLKISDYRLMHAVSSTTTSDF